MMGPLGCMRFAVVWYVKAYREKNSDAIPDAHGISLYTVSKIHRKYTANATPDSGVLSIVYIYIYIIYCI